MQLMLIHSLVTRSALAACGNMTASEECTEELAPWAIVIIVLVTLLTVVGLGSFFFSTEAKECAAELGCGDICSKRSAVSRYESVPAEELVMKIDNSSDSDSDKVRAVRWLLVSASQERQMLQYHEVGASTGCTNEQQPH